jgi:glycine C-acetyltransferase
MLKHEFSYTPPAALSGSLRDFRRARGADLQARVEGFAKWRNLRLQHGLWPFAHVVDEAPATTSAADFTCADALGAGSHPAVVGAAREALSAFGAHGGGSAALDAAARLERRIAEFLDTPETAVFPSGWAAAYGAVKALARSTDHVVLDAYAPAGLKEGAAAATRNVYVFRHNRVDECRGWLQKIRAADADNGIVVAVETLSSVEGDCADLNALQALCHEFGAMLVAHAGHDLGALGANGGGVLADQEMLGRIDVVTGGLAEGFAASSGFVTGRSADLTEYVRAFGSSGAHVGISPVEAAAALAAFDVVEGEEGQKLRDALMANISTLRQQLCDAGLDMIGDPSPQVLVKLGPEGLARLVARQAPSAGLLASLVEFPSAPKDEARMALHVTAQHSKAQLRDAVAALANACRSGREEFDWLNNEREKLRANV